MISKQFSSSKVQADLFGILGMDEEGKIRLETNSVLSPRKVPHPLESVPLPPVRVAMTSGDMSPLSSPSKPSLPNSATSSPRRLLLKKWRHDGGQTPPRVADMNTPNFILTVPDLRRSKSCGEGRLCAPPQPEEFKCGALCLFLPGFGRGKPVRAKKADIENSADRFMISRSVSLEKFESYSWESSSTAVEESTGGSMCFDLPLELIRTSGNETTSPVAAAFVFDKELKGVLKNNGARKSSAHESARHVRFSTSSPMSDPTSPRLRKASEDFNALLEAQSA